MPLLDLTIVAGKSFKSRTLGAADGHALALDLESTQSHSDHAQAGVGAAHGLLSRRSMPRRSGGKHGKGPQRPRRQP